MPYLLYHSTAEASEIGGSLTFKQFLCYGHVAHVVHECRVYASPSFHIEQSPEKWSAPIPCDGSCKERYVTRIPGVPEEVHAACVRMRT